MNIRYRLNLGSEVSRVVNSKPIAMIDKNTNETIKIFSCIKDAERFLNINYRSHIPKICNGERQTFKGYK